VFNMDGLIAAADSMQRDCHLPDFVIEKPEAWFKCVEAQLEDAKVVKPKDKHNKVLGKLPVHIIEELALVTDDPSAYADPYTALKERLLAAYGRSKWEKLNSLLNFPKMGVNERPSVVLPCLNTLKPASLEELFCAIYLRVLPDGYHEHFSRCQFKTAEELAAVADGLWEMRGGNPAVVVAVGHSASPGWQQSPHRQQQQQHRGCDGGSGNRRGGGRRNRSNGSRGGQAAASAVVTAPPLLGEPSKMMAPAPMVAAAAVAACTWVRASASIITPTAALPPEASLPASSLRETRQLPAATSWFHSSDGFLIHELVIPGGEPFLRRLPVP
jgi:hypothetical protein